MTPKMDQIVADGATVIDFSKTKDSAGGRVFGPLKLKTIDDALNAPARDYIIKGLFSPGEMSTIYGPRKSGKSFATLHLAYSIAQGREPWGRRVKQTPALYVIQEGGAGFTKRVTATTQKLGQCESFYFMNQPVTLFSDPALADHLISAAKSVGAGFIVIDTHARAMSGGEENSAKDTGMMVAIYDRIRHETGAHLCIVHHTGHDEVKGGRGSTALPAAVDISIKVSRDKTTGISSLEIIEARDDQDGHALNFKLRKADLGLDADGDPIDTLVVEETDEVAVSALPPKRARMTPAEQTDFDLIVKLFNDRPGALVERRASPHSVTVTPCARRDDVRDWLTENGRLLRNADRNAETENNKLRQQLHRTLNSLKNKGKIGCDAEWVWIESQERDA